MMRFSSQEHSCACTVVLSKLYALGVVNGVYGVLYANGESAFACALGVAFVGRGVGGEDVPVVERGQGFDFVDSVVVVKRVAFVLFCVEVGVD
eukprot:3941487-Rhodomonas_salina.1